MSMFYLFFGIEKNTFRGEILVFILFLLEPHVISLSLNHTQLNSRQTCA